MKKQTKQLVVFVLAILLVIGWAMWPRSLEGLILKHHTATDFSTIEQFNVRWTPPNAVQDYAADAYPHWTLEKELTQPILDILRKATVSRPSGNTMLIIGDEGIYDLSTWCFHVSITTQGEIQVWNTVYKLDRKSFNAIWSILTESNPER